MTIATSKINFYNTLQKKLLQYSKFKNTFSVKLNLKLESFAERESIRIKVKITSALQTVDAKALILLKLLSLDFTLRVSSVARGRRAIILPPPH